MNNVEQRLKESKKIGTILANAKYLYELEPEEYSKKYSCVLDIINLDSTPNERINKHRYNFIEIAYEIAVTPSLNELGKSMTILCVAERVLNEKMLDILEANKEQFIGTPKELLVKRLVIPKSEV